MSRTRIGDVTGPGREWDERVLAEAAFEETTGNNSADALTWRTVMIVIIIVLLFVAAIAMIQQFHLYETFAGRKV